MIFDRSNKSDAELMTIYQHLLYPRLIEEKMLILLRQGRIGKWFSGIGQEAIAVGSTLAMLSHEYILPMHRNLGVFTSRDIPLHRLVSQWLGKKNGFTKGRDRSFHFGTQEHKIIGMISHLAAQMPVAAGIALASKLKKEHAATLVFTGEGATSEGDFHEALNLASVWDLPVIFLIENNGYGLSTPTAEQYKCKHLVDKAIGYGIEGYKIDGNNVLEIIDTITNIAEDIRQNPRPILVECLTFRMRGHEEASGIKYVPKDLLEKWAKNDPIQNYEQYLINLGLLNNDKIDSIRSKFKQHIDQEIEFAFSDEEPTIDTETEINDMYVPHFSVKTEISEKQINMRYIDAISDALKIALQKYNNLIMMGQDIAEYGGAFKVTDGFVELYGKERVRNTPICESVVVGAALGLSINSYKSVVEMQFADFVSVGFNQIINNLAKTHYRWGEKADVVIRMPTGAGTGAGPFHSQSNEAWFTKTPGLKIVYPAFPADAKALLLSAIDDPNPVLFFEHKYLYRSLEGLVPEGYSSIAIGKANWLRKGTQLSIITYGMGVHWAIEYLNNHPEVEANLIDLRSLQPWDNQTVCEAVKLSGKVLVLHEDTLTSGFGAEIAAWIAEHCFEYLDAPVLRCASLDTAIPMNKSLENNFLAKNRLEENINKLLNY